MKLNILKDGMGQAVENKDFMKAQELKLEMDRSEKELIRLQNEFTDAATVANEQSSDLEKTKVCTLNHFVSICIKSRFLLYLQLESETNEPPKVEDPTVVHKCLEIIYMLLQDMGIKALNPTLQTLFDELVLPSIQSLETEIRKSAVKTMGVCCLRSIGLARQHLLLLFQVC